MRPESHQFVDACLVAFGQVTASDVGGHRQILASAVGHVGDQLVGGATRKGHCCGTERVVRRLLLPFNNSIRYYCYTKALLASLRQLSNSSMRYRLSRITYLAFSKKTLCATRSQNSSITKLTGIPSIATVSRHALLRSARNSIAPYRSLLASSAANLPTRLLATCWLRQ